jgi:DNA-binding MarR family transcriptional regulator
MVNEECERQIVDLLGQISHELFTHSRRLARRTGLTRPQLATMLALLREGEASSGALARRLSLSAPTLSGILDRLEDKGVVERRRGSRDRRAVWVRATRDAHTLLDAELSLLGPGFPGRLDRLSDEDKDGIVESLRRLAALMAESPDRWDGGADPSPVSPAPADPLQEAAR